MPLRVATPPAARLRVRDGFGAEIRVPLMGGGVKVVGIPSEDQSELLVRVSDGGRLRVRPASLAVQNGSVGVALGRATVSGIGSARAASIGTAAGQATVSGVGATVAASAEATGTAAGSATVQGVAAAVAAAQGTAAGAATATGAGAARAAAVGASSGAAAVSGVGAARAASTGSSAGVATVSGVGATAGGAFDPASLFGVGDVGFFFDFTTADCYTNTTRTTSAGIADAVAGVTDLSGTGAHASQSTTGSRPALQQTGGGLQHLVFDGIDDRLDVTVNMTGKNSITIWAVIEKTGDVGVGRIAGNSLSAGRAQLLGPATGVDKRYRLNLARTDNTFGREANSLDTYQAPDLAYLVGVHVGDNVTVPCAVLRRNGSQVGTNPLTSLWSGLGSQVWRVGNQEFGNEDYQGKIFAIGMISRALTSGELADLEAWCATRGGI